MDEDIKKRFIVLETALNDLSNSIKNPRVQIENLEGVFKTVSVAPAVEDYRDGVVLLFDDGADRKIYAKLNGVFYSTTIT
jgi:hypothetical protein